jgi:hypothetical protein
MSDKPTITLTLEVRDTFVQDLLTAACEGGSAYWLRGAVHYKLDENSAPEYVEKVTKCFDAEDRSTKFEDITLDTVRLGIKRIVQGELVRPDIKSTVLRCLMDGDCSDWDAETADVVLQVGLLGSVVYG